MRVPQFSGLQKVAARRAEGFPKAQVLGARQRRPGPVAMERETLCG